MVGGMLTNWGTISNSIKKLQKINKDCPQKIEVSRKRIIKNECSKR